MDKHNSVFHQCQTLEAISSQLQDLIKKLLQGVHPHHPLPSHHNSDERDSIDLSVLRELSYADLKHHKHPVLLLSEICRLLIKQGDPNSLGLCGELSHIIYAFTGQQHASRYISSLYKGITQIGLHLTDLGIKNVLFGLSGSRNFRLIPLDSALGYWALMSAAVIKRNLKLSLTFAEKWYESACEGQFAGEVFRASLTILLFQLLLGDSEQCLKLRQQIIHNPQKEWQSAIHFLDTWTDMVIQNGDLTIPNASEPYPLLLGVTWCLPPDSRVGVDNVDMSVEDFFCLCQIRLKLCHENTVNTLSFEEFERYAGCLAYWELPKPLYTLETILKNKAVDKNLHYLMTRLLGKQVLESVINKTPLDPDVITQEEAIILVMDVRKYSELSEHRTPDEVFDILNPVFKIMNEELELAGGTILEFVGDCIIIVFNTFNKQDSDISDILCHTVRGLQRIHVLNTLSLQTDRPEIRIGVGISKGPVGLGYLGGLRRCHLTVLGNTINLAARIETSTKTLPGSIIISASCVDGREPDIWKNPQNINFSLRDLGCHVMRNISQPVHLFGVHPLLRYWIDFVPMGFVANPEAGVVYIDTGNSDQPGIIDHHFASQIANSACELLNQQPELLLAHLKDCPVSRIEFRLHSNPDLDCAATLYSAYELMDSQPRREILQKLAAYISSIDQGHIPQAGQLCDSLYGIFLAHQNIVEHSSETRVTDLLLLEAELRVIDAAVYLMEQYPVEGDFSSIFRFQPDWFAQERQLIQEDIECYHQDVRFRSHPYIARINGYSEPVTGLWLEHPQSIFFKLWAQNDPNAPDGKGYQFLTVDLSQSGNNRFIIRVDPESGTDLKGLGQLLEQHESRKRKQQGKERPIYPIRYPSNNSDPWYFGQGHAYTIIDSPHAGTILTAEEVQKVHEGWRGENYKDFA